LEWWPAASCHLSASESFKDRIKISSIADAVVIEPNYELSTFDRYTVNRDGNVSVKKAR
jgi:hypothetical protein